MNQEKIIISDLFFTEKEAAQFVDVNVATIWLWIKQGKLEAQHIGGKIVNNRIVGGITLIRKDDLALVKRSPVGRKKKEASNAN